MCVFLVVFVFEEDVHVQVAISFQFVFSGIQQFENWIGLSGDTSVVQLSGDTDGWHSSHLDLFLDWTISINERQWSHATLT